MSPSPARADRPPLNRTTVIAAAILLADEIGIERLSMRKLGDALDVEAMSLYNHVANKDDLLDGLVDAVFAEIGFDAHAPWRDAMHERAHSARAALLRHRWAVGLLDSRTSPGPATLAHHDAVLGCLRRSGFTVEDSAHAFALLDSYTYGFVLQEVALPFDDGDDVAAAATEILPTDMAETYPHLAELTMEHVMAVGYSFSKEFDWGLTVVLDGLERATAGDHSPS